MVKFLSHHVRRHARRTAQKTTAGFTMIEVLIAAALAGMIISGLLYLVLELMGTNQREAARDETQQDMQNALDYVSSELRESVYIYPPVCLTGRGAPGSDDFCPGVLNHLPPNLTQNSVPVVAFWKQERFPDAVLQACANGGAPPGTNCINGHSYSLIVYLLSDGANWDGQAQLSRYALTEFTQGGALRAGYTNPGAQQNFRTWPFLGDENLQAGIPDGRPDVLVDFVDRGTGANAQFVSANQSVCPTDYTVSPPDALLAATGFDGVRSFYACIGPSATNRNTEVILRLRGNADGRAGAQNENSFMTALETRVLSRGVIGKTPLD
ncbi:MAG: type II secretion system protein [Leptolyngbya sp. DLM2.Bin15]|nr:MAG: type II secretion system protein [Leptolyngbya sp. DLM2.Bin15]